jgi:hypothetical protein
MKCSGNESLKCSNCYDREAVLKVVNKMAEKKLNDKIDKFEVEIEEEEDFYTIIYTHIELFNNPLKKGGSTFIKISKKDCKVVDYKISK